MFLTQKPNLNLSPDYVAAWRKCLPDDFQGAFPDDSIDVSPEISELFQADRDSDSVIIDLTSKSDVKMGKTQALLCLTWLMDDMNTNITPLMDIPVFREAIGGLVKNVVGPRMARGIITRNYDNIKELSQDVSVTPKPEPVAPTPSVGMER